MSEKKQSGKPENKTEQRYKPWLRKQGRGGGQGREQIRKKDPEGLPSLTFGPNNNFAKFKEALASKALRDYGDLGRLIESGHYYVPVPPDPDDYDLINDLYQLNHAMFLEQQKLYMKHQEDMVNQRPKLYAMIWQYLSQESKDEVKRSQEYEQMKETRDVEKLWQTIEETHKVFTISRIAAVIKKSAWKEYQTMHQGPYESIITYKERFDIALRAYQEQENAEILQPDIAMDFFDGLDNGCYADFKKSILKGMTAGSVTQPATLNEMYLLANQWLKTTGVTQSGSASTFVTKLDMPEQGRAGKRENKDKSEKGKPAVAKPKRNMTKVKCFNCGCKGHIAPNCPEKEAEQETTAKDDEGKAKSFVTWEDGWEEQEEIGTYVPYQVMNASEGRGFHEYDVLLDNQADVSIVHPRLLREVIQADRPVTVKGIGGRQLVVEKTGYLDEFFRVYASEIGSRMY
jgi:hypothetical protein